MDGDFCCCCFEVGFLWLVRCHAGGRVPMTRMGRWQQGQLTMWGGGFTTGRSLEHWRAEACLGPLLFNELGWMFNELALTWPQP